MLEQIADEHERLVDALERRYADEALSVLAEHLHRSEYALEQRERAPAKR